MASEAVLSGKKRALLRGCANGMAAAFQMGKGGLDAELTSAVESCLKKRELVKLRLLETCPLSAREAADALAQSCEAQVVQVIGRVVVLFRPKKKESAYAALLK